MNDSKQTISGATLPVRRAASPASRAQALPIEDVFVPSRAVDRRPAGLIPAAAPSLFAPPSADPDSLEGDNVNVRVNEWFLCEKGKSYLVDTAGCGAIKIFVDCPGGSDSDYAIAFHSYGTQDSKDAAAQIGAYILAGRVKPDGVRLVSLQPFEVSSDVMDTVDVIRDAVEKRGGIHFEARVVCLNNIEGEKFSRFVRVDLEGSEQEILQRHDHLVIKSPQMSDEDRRTKILLFQSLPIEVRTPEFIRKWSGLTLEEARKCVEDINRKKTPWWRRVFSQCLGPTGTFR